jgi:C1A family cysteine protease
MATLQSGIDLSRLFLYYNSRALEGTTSVDAGAFIRDAIKSAANTGVCLESYWMYKPELFAESPPLDAYEEALNHQAIIYAAVEPNSQAVMLALADGFPVVFGFTVYDGFYRPEVSEHGILSMPTASERVVGGHACLIVGYDRAAQRFIVRNSWGEAFGDQGYFSIPFSYVESLASDFWVIKKVE